MALLEMLMKNKGTVSSELGKKIARDVLDGDSEVLDEAIPLVCYELKNKSFKHVRAGAAKIVEIVAENNPVITAPYLEELLSALEAEEPQTRWMIIRTMGFCASQKPDISKMAIPFALKYIRDKRAGQLCLVGAADMYLGDYGALSKECAREVFPILIESTGNVIKNEHDWIIEAFIKIAGLLSKKEHKAMLEFADRYDDHPRKATIARVKKIHEICE